MVEPDDLGLSHGYYISSISFVSIHHHIGKFDSYKADQILRLKLLLYLKKIKAVK